MGDLADLFATFVKVGFLESLVAGGKTNEVDGQEGKGREARIGLGLGFDCSPDGERGKGRII